MNRSFAPAILLSALLAIFSACASGPTAMPQVSPAASPSTAPTAPAPSVTLPITTPDAAAARVIASDARFAGIGPRDPNVSGRCCWYSTVPLADGSFQVAIEIGWGDCPAGCMNKHDWLYMVGPDGTVTLAREGGPEVPAGVGGVGGNATASGFDDLPAGPGIAGQALAGPTCPVVQPADPACTDRPVPGATILIRDEQRTVVAQLETDESGRFRIVLPPGAYRLEPQPVQGLMGTAPAIEVTVGGTFQIVQIAYDTGIR
jgi:hypothetical protein